MDGRGATETMGGNRQRAGRVRRVRGALLEIGCKGRKATRFLLWNSQNSQPCREAGGQVEECQAQHNRGGGREGDREGWVGGRQT